MKMAAQGPPSKDEFDKDLKEQEGRGRGGYSKANSCLAAAVCLTDSSLRSLMAQLAWSELQGAVRLTAE
jgi:hypothetical protein